MLLPPHPHFDWEQGLDFRQRVVVATEVSKYVRFKITRREDAAVFLPLHPFSDREQGTDFGKCVTGPPAENQCLRTSMASGETDFG